MKRQAHSLPRQRDTFSDTRSLPGRRTQKHPSAEGVRRKAPSKPSASRARRRIGLALMSAGLLFVLLLTGYMYRYSMISSMKYEINRKYKELEELQNQKKELHLEIEKTKRSDLIESTAREQLGMEYPTEEQLIYITVE
ncbi:MAG: cell division protein FtsL [Peptostreptococcaceae bacterium]|nr:cell division protein FtsL [Peptostreptococcaceae bacterium]